MYMISCRYKAGVGMLMIRLPTDSMKTSEHSLPNGKGNAALPLGMCQYFQLSLLGVGDLHGLIWI